VVAAATGKKDTSDHKMRKELLLIVLRILCFIAAAIFYNLQTPQVCPIIGDSDLSGTVFEGI
jgi:hypothetical protein